MEKQQQQQNQTNKLTNPTNTNDRPYGKHLVLVGKQVLTYRNLMSYLQV